jgi:hypothetical protein
MECPLRFELTPKNDAYRKKRRALSDAAKVVAETMPCMLQHIMRSFPREKRGFCTVLAHISQSALI